ncbi:hypothetical protein Mapa_008146 [Marchantia paleacea]|nr:hypothetical protein Mapa_008146 [Marchantia paleacea]
MAPLQELMARDGFKHQNLLSFFISRVQTNLHIVLSLNTRHPDHEARLQKCSAVVSKCTILRVDSWSEKGLLEFLHARLRKAPEPELDGELNKNLEQIMMDIHRSVVKIHVSVSSSQFVAFVEEFTTIFSKKKADLTSQMLHLQVRYHALTDFAILRHVNWYIEHREFKVIFVLLKLQHSRTFIPFESHLLCKAGMKGLLLQSRSLVFLPMTSMFNVDCSQALEMFALVHHWN